MPKSIPIHPSDVRMASTLTSRPIPINAYQADPAAEARKYGSPSLVRIYHDMLLIREFETLLDVIKREGVYKGVAYKHGGPAHLSIGQEASVVGQATTSRRMTSSSAHTAVMAKS